MEVSKEVKDGLLSQIDYVIADMGGIHRSITSLHKYVASLSVATPQPAPAAHEWKVGDFFRCGKDVRQIVATGPGFSAIDQEGNDRFIWTMPVKSVAQLMDYYTLAEPITLDDWFAAVRKAQNEGKSEAQVVAEMEMLLRASREPDQPDVPPEVAEEEALWESRAANTPPPEEPE